MLHNRDGLNEY